MSPTSTLVLQEKTGINVRKTISSWRFGKNGPVVQNSEKSLRYPVLGSVVPFGSNLNVPS